MPRSDRYHLAILVIMIFFVLLNSPNLSVALDIENDEPALRLDAIDSVDPSIELDSDEDFDEFEDEFGALNGQEIFDPLSGYNRSVTRFNDKFYDWVVYPVAEGYNFVVPEPSRTAMSRFFKNLFFPLRFVNNFLQLKFKGAAVETARFLVNTTVGLVGFFDPATSWLHLDPYPEDFGQTLGFYGVGSGFHIVLPFLGPSNLRDFVGLFPDAYSVPIPYFSNTGTAIGIESYRRLNVASLRLGEYESLRRDALDLYTFLRDAYESNRKALIEE